MRYYCPKCSNPVQYLINTDEYVCDKCKLAFEVLDIEKDHVRYSKVPDHQIKPRRQL